MIPNAHEAAFLSCVLPYADQFDPTLMRLAFAFIVIGFGTKAGLFPMHTLAARCPLPGPEPCLGPAFGACCLSAPCL